MSAFGSPVPGVHPLASIGGPPEDREWLAGTSAAHAPEVDPSARVSAFVTVDAGVRDATRVGARTFLMAHVHVGHDAQIGAGCELAPGTVIGGHAQVGDGVRIGMNATVLPYRKVGAGARVGAGAVVTHDVPPGEVWAGVPAAPLRGTA